MSAINPEDVGADADGRGTLPGPRRHPSTIPVVVNPEAIGDPYVMINGHHPTCAYIRTLHWDDTPEECDCDDLDIDPDPARPWNDTVDGDE